MRYKGFKTESYQMIPVLGLEEINDKKKYNYIINRVTEMNKSYANKGIGNRVRDQKTGEITQVDAPNFSYRLYKDDGKIQQHVTVPRNLKDTLLTTLFNDMHKGCKFTPSKLDLSGEHLTAFAIKGNPHLAIDLEGKYHQQIKNLFQGISKHEKLLYNITIKEVENQKQRRREMERAMTGGTGKFVMKQTKKLSQLAWNGTKNKSDEGVKEFMEGMEAIKEWFLPANKKNEAHPLSRIRLEAENIHFMDCEILFLLWTNNTKKVTSFKNKLEKLMEQMQGENKLKVTEIKPDLTKIAHGHIQYEKTPLLCLYQTELDKFLYIPEPDDVKEVFYNECQQKTQIPEVMFKNQKGALALCKELYTNTVAYMPKPISATDIDNRIKAMLLVGEQGSGKTSLIENQILETFLAGATDEKEWLKHGKSTIAFEVADGALIQSVQQHIPDWAKRNVIVINHADTENPVYVGFHDVLKVNKESRSIKKQVADTETKILLDSIGDSSKTIAVERHFKAALQASYEAGKGNLVDALSILKDETYFNVIVNKLIDLKKYTLVNVLKGNMEDMKNDPTVLKTIKNRIMPFMADEDFMNLVAQDVNQEIDFWKWMNGEPYLVLIYLPGSGQEISQELRKFLFTNYFVKIWMLMLARERIEKEKRKECLVIIDELHQVIDQRAIQNLFGSLFKEPRKYRFRFIFSIHGWSSFNEAGKNKDKLIGAIEDARPNLVLLKGGDGFFKSMASLLAPYDLKDYTSLMNSKFCGVFRIDAGGKTHIFMAQLIEPASMRLPIYQKISLEESRNLMNCLGRSRIEVEAKIHGIKKEEKTEKPKEDVTAKKDEKKEETACNNKQEKSRNGFAMISRESGFQPVN
ncbi:hypothetical protein IC620_15965 [Hazenella sp. IB182357]|uniref:AAA+ ATPase domain-containing protein n=1 Tax=Polycladospora coralii TaxID=2771432 RepID=A0A926N891_9BACL|nr:hypothetical protein [Polycladospora coralii]MBD1373841.1 hypothetical protein [Polycladospora coralii]